MCVKFEVFIKPSFNNINRLLFKTSKFKFKIILKKIKDKLITILLIYKRKHLLYNSLIKTVKKSNLINIVFRLNKLGLWLYT